jgi:hypothetical protein
MQKPSLGRIVLFHELGKEPAPAIVTRVWTDTTVNITVFRDAIDSQPRTSVEYADPENPAGRSEFWSWPPRV